MSRQRCSRSSTSGAAAAEGSAFCSAAAGFIARHRWWQSVRLGSGHMAGDAEEHPDVAAARRDPRLAVGREVLV